KSADIPFPGCAGRSQEDGRCLPPLQLRPSLLLRVKLVQKKMRCISHLPVSYSPPQDL
ncbi:hypothetical protein CHARACLAT_007063, partial [Characodon lateralis]|nr:hypothetical protein [Characodon lateralis]